MGKSYNLAIARVAKFASKEPYRTSLNDCYWDEKLKAMVACDGHRLIADKALPNMQPFKASVYLKTKEYAFTPASEFKPRDLASLIPDLSNYASVGFKFEVPIWFEKVANCKKAVPMFFTEHGTVSITKTKDSIFCLNASLLAPLAGEVITMKYALPKKHVDANGDEIFTPQAAHAPLYFHITSQTFGVIMPMRM